MTKENGPYLPPEVPDNPQELPDGAEARFARRQLIGAAVVIVVLLAAVLAMILLFQSSQPDKLSGRSLLEYDGLTYEQVEETEEFSALGLAAPLSPADCGEKVAVLTEGVTLYRLQRSDTRALLVAEKGGAFELYRFCYFAGSAEHTGGEILEVITDGTSLAGVDCYGNTGGWSRLLRSTEELEQFKTLFASLHSVKDPDETRSQMEQTAWDTMITLRCKNGLTFHLSVYSTLKAAAGFRTVYDLPGDFLDLIGNT